MILKNFFKSRILKNQRGSTLTITLAVIAVLSFSVVSVTKLTVNLSSATTRHMQIANDEALGKALITKAINDMQEYITNQGSYDGFDSAIKPGIEEELGVGIINSTELFDGFGDNDSVNSRIYKFSYLMSNGQTLFKYSFISSIGSTFETPHPFSFSLGTDSDLVLNGGYYDDISIYGENIYLSDIAVYTDEDSSTNYVTVPNIYNFPDFTSGLQATRIYYEDNYKYCTYGCFEATEDQSEPFVLRDDLYYDVNGSAYGEPGDVVENNISKFFSSFILSDYLLEYGLSILPTADREIVDPTINIDNFAVRITEYADPAPNGGGTSSAYYDDITNYDLYDPQTVDTTFSKGVLWEGDELIISRDHIFSNTQQTGMVVVGDLHIDNTQEADPLGNGNANGNAFGRFLSSGNPITISGTYIITGDLLVSGYDISFDNCTFIVLGSVEFDFDDGRGFETFGAFEDFSIISGDNVVFTSIWEGLSLKMLFTKFIPTVMLIYTDESIWIDSVDSRLAIQGALYAKGTGDSENPIPMETSEGMQVNGIVINSYKNVQSNHNFWDFYIPFRLEELPQNEFEIYFSNIPILENVTVADAEFTVDLGEWQKE